MARKTAANANGAEEEAGFVAPEDAVYSMWCSVCKENMQFVEIPANRLLECPHCGETVMVPDSLGNEPVDEEA